MKIFVNPDNLPSSSRAIAYGDGCFTTMLFDGQELKHLELHVQRLEDNCAQLLMEGFNQEQLISSLKELTSKLDHDKHVIKVLVSAGAGGRGYSRRPEAPLEVVISEHIFPNLYEHWQKQGIKLGISSQALSKQPLLAGVKHLNRLEQVLVKASVTNDEIYDDVLVTDTDHMLIESSAGNLFWRQGQQWFTPDLHCSGVAGVIRNRIIRELDKLGRSAVEVRTRSRALLAAEEIFICNSVMGLVPVKEIWLPTGENQQFTIHSSCFKRLLAAC